MNTLTYTTVIIGKSPRGRPPAHFWPPYTLMYVK